MKPLKIENHLFFVVGCLFILASIMNESLLSIMMDVFFTRVPDTVTDPMHKDYTSGFKYELAPFKTIVTRLLDIH